MEPDLECPPVARPNNNVAPTDHTAGVENPQREKHNGEPGEACVRLNCFPHWLRHNHHQQTKPGVRPG
ncbi:hypothetical protein ZHAS_00003395 [Anopheles sinensis]|uniref:Uncharacterized protein n=1 Tax=Anopheles sinensis TaxID=74873 RepID=A0A084VE82_ANOSI|nr:hypothetical protein ZHAS_00003395 [Anopheles sinensis]